MKKEPNTTFIPPTLLEETKEKPVRKAPRRKPIPKKQSVEEANPADEQLVEEIDFEQQAEETEPTALELIRQKSGLSEDDVAMLFALGYENELGRLVGYENLKKLQAENFKRTGKSEDRHYRTAFGYRGEEYTDEQDRVTVQAAYAKDRKKLLFRTVFSAIFSLLLLFADLPSMILPGLPPFFSDNQWIFPVAGMLLLSCVALCSRTQVNAGIRSLLSFRPTPYSIPAILLPVALIYDLASLFTDGDMLPVNLLTSLVFLALIACDLLRFSCEHRTLSLLSETDSKHVLVPATPRKRKLRQGNKIIKIINDDIGENRYSIRRCRHTVGFFRRFNDMQSASRPLTISLALSFSLAVATAFANAILHDSLSLALSGFMTVVLISAPLCTVQALFFPLFHANRLLSRLNCALLGDETVEEYAIPKAVIFRDTDLYTVETRTEISVAKNDDFKNDMRLAGILFRKLGGTLASLGAAAPDAESDPPVSILRIAESGVEAMIDNRHHLLAGDALFLTRNGVSVPKESTDKTLRRTSEVSLMYVAVNGILKLSYEIEYEARASFERMVCDLAEIDCAAAISSFDPNLDDVFLQKSRFSASDPITVVKPNHFEEDAPLEMADVGAVALDDERDLIHPLFAAHGISKTKRFAFRLQLIATVLGGALTALLSVLGEPAALGILPIIGFQALFSGILLIASLCEINGASLRLHKKY